MCQYHHHIIKYCDDLIGYGLPTKIDASFNTLCIFLYELGFTISEAKLVLPSTSVICLGILINTFDGTVSVPPEKLHTAVSSRDFSFFTLKSINLIGSSFLLSHLTHYSACTLRTHTGFV